jgi:hypothetical protein
LGIREGFVFGRVIARRICQYKPWPAIESDGTKIDIPDNSAQTEIRFRDPRNTQNDILYLDSSVNAGFPWIFHGAIGIKPQYIYMYPRFPETKEIPGKFPEVDPIRPATGDMLGYINSLTSPYENPTDYIEWVIPPHTHVAAEFYNQDQQRHHQPVLNLLFALYWFQPFNATRLPNLIRRIASREVPAAFLKVGFGDFPHELGSAIQRDWDAEPLTLDEAVSLGGGR